MHLILDDEVIHDSISDLREFKTDQVHTHQRYASHANSPWPMAMEHDHTLSALCYILERPYPFTLFPIKSLGNFFQFVPCRVGYNAALDKAISCLCSMYTRWRICTPRVSKYSVRLYTESLKHLRKCLAVPQLRAKSETICASIILQLCEVGIILPSIYILDWF